MPTIVDAQVSSRGETDASEPDLSLPERLARHVDEKKLAAMFAVPSATITVTFVPSSFGFPESSAFPEITLSTPPEHEDLRKSLTDAWSAVYDLREFNLTTVHRSTRATNPTSSTVSSAARLLRKQHRDKRLHNISPEAKATYERIRKLRDEIGPIDFDVVKALRELRNDE